MIKAVEEKIRLLNKHRADVKTKLSEILEAQVEEHETRIKHFQMVATQINKFAGKNKESSGLKFWKQSVMWYSLS